MFGFPPARARLFAVVLAQALVGGGGCSKDPAAIKPDGGDGGGGGDPGRDGGLVGCPLQTICDGNAVRVCQPDGAGPVIEVCADGAVCSRGRCASASCAEAEKEETVTFAGCVFYAAQLDNVDSDDGQPNTIIITNPGTAPVTVTVEARAPGQPWAALDAPLIVQPGSAQSYAPGDRHLEGPGRSAARALRVVSDAPVTALTVQSDDSTETSSSSAGTFLLPAHALGLEYMAITYVQRVTPKVAAIAGARNGAGEILIVATQDGTDVTVTVPATATVTGLPPGATAGDGGTADNGGGGRGARFTVSLDDGDGYQLFSTNEGDDLSGTTISSKKPIAVFSGNVSTTYGFASDGFNSPDMAAEQQLPLASWSRSYIAAGLQPQTASGCDSPFGNAVYGFWRILSSADGNSITFDSPTAIPELSDQGWTLNRGEARDLPLSGGGDFVVTGRFPIMVIQGMDCEATLSPAVSSVELMSDLLFALPPNFDHQLAIVRPRGSAIRLDGTVISSAQFFDAGGSFEAARIHVPPCVGPAASCVHHLSGKFGVTLRGMDVVSSYAVTVPTWPKCLDTGCVN